MKSSSYGLCHGQLTMVLRKKRSKSGFLIAVSPSVPFLTPLSLFEWAFEVSCTQNLFSEN